MAAPSESPEWLPGPPSLPPAWLPAGEEGAFGDESPGCGQPPGLGNEFPAPGGSFPSGGGIKQPASHWGPEGEPGVKGGGPRRPPRQGSRFPLSPLAGNRWGGQPKAAKAPGSLREARNVLSSKEAQFSSWWESHGARKGGGLSVSVMLSAFRLLEERGCLAVLLSGAPAKRWLLGPEASWQGSLREPHGRVRPVAGAVGGLCGGGKAGQVPSSARSGCPSRCPPSGTVGHRDLPRRAAGLGASPGREAAAPGGSP